MRFAERSLRGLVGLRFLPTSVDLRRRRHPKRVRLLGSVCPRGHGQCRLWLLRNTDPNLHGDLRLDRVERMHEPGQLPTWLPGRTDLRELRHAHAPVPGQLLVERLDRVSRLGSLLAGAAAGSGVRELWNSVPHLHERMPVAHRLGVVSEPRDLCAWRHLRVRLRDLPW